ncbi:signal peptidase I [Compostibacter hankyongensis]|uniref:Signal peptidase I n=1 Tax=Compostibacter hankyongensis TaxID=1007089 RepID=A0ABP8G2P4_9BACT
MIFNRTKKEKKTAGRRKKSPLREWTEALVFALLVAGPIRIFGFGLYHIPSASMEHTLMTGDYIFVDKWSYGARIPMTPLSVPFVQNSIFGLRSFSTLISLPYLRTPAAGEIRRNDVVVFNFPAGDTVIDRPEYGSEITYYQVMRELGREETWKKFGQDIVVRPVDKEENFVKRCVGLPGDTLQLTDNNLYINGRLSALPAEAEGNYRVQTNGTPFNGERLKELGIATPGQYAADTYVFSLTPGQLKTLRSFTNVVDISRMERASSGELFPHDPQHFSWSNGNYGPVYIPRKGATVRLDSASVSLYKRIITTYEGNKLTVSGNRILINGKETDHYTFRKNYYWMMGDNRDNSLDSRYWGFVPEDHIVGKPRFVYFSKGDDGIRWNHLFSGIN